MTMRMWLPFLLAFSVLRSTVLTETQAPKVICRNVAAADIVYLVDGSSSIGRVNFQEVKYFIGETIRPFVNVRQNAVRFGLVQYSDDPRLEFTFRDHGNQSQVLTAVHNMRYKGGNTRTGVGLKYVADNYFGSTKLKRNVPKITILITDGKSQDDVGDSAAKLKSQDVKLFAVGIKNADKKELDELSSKPTEEYSFFVNDFRILKTLSRLVSQRVCTIAGGVLEVLGAAAVFGGPSNLKFTDERFESMRIRWTAAVGPVTGYKVQFTPLTILGNTITAELREIAVRGNENIAYLQGLKPATEYLVTVIAQYANSIGESTSGKRRTRALTGVSNFRVVSVGHFHLKLAWKSPAGSIQSYYVTFGARGDSNTQMKERTVNANANSITLEQLQPDTEYIATIRPIYLRNAAAPVSVSGKTLSLEPVQQLTVQSASAQSVTVAWRGVRGATGYRVVWRPLTGQSILKVDVDQNTKSYGIQGLQPNTDYGITVTALYGAAEGPPATARVKTVGGLHAVRERKREPALDVAEDLNLRILALSPTIIRVSWFIQRDVIGYRIEWRKTSEERSQSQRVLLTPATNNYDITNLVPGTQYTITLYTLYTGREVATPAITSETVGKEIILGRITNLRAIQIGSNQIRLEWTGVTGATEYKIIWRNAEGYEITRLVSKDVTSFVIDRLQQGGPYLIKVLPLSGSRDGSATSISVRTDISVGQVGSLRIVETKNNRIRITWIRAPEATGYRIIWKLADGREESRVVSSSVNTFDIEGLKSETLYLIGVSAMVGNQEGRPITISARTDPPQEGVYTSRVTNLRVTETGFTRMRIEWDIIARATGYRLKWRGSDGSVGNKVVRSNIALFDIERLQPDTVYAVEISAIVDNREGIPTSTTMRTAAGGVTNIRMVEARPSHIQISWTGVGRVSGYRITWRRPDGVMDNRTVGRDVNSFNIERLAPQTVYAIKVIPLFGNQEGTPGTLTVETANGINIEGVSSVRVLEARSDVLRVSWVGVRAATNYRVSWSRSDGGAETSRVVPGDIYTIDIPGLEGGVSYNVKVVALIENSEGPPVTIIATTPTLNRPVNNVSNLRVIDSSKRRIRIAWSGVSGSSGYRIYWRLADGGSEFNSVVPANVNLFDIDNLKAGERYIIRVSSLSGNQEGTSASITGTTARAEQVRGFRVTGSDMSKITVGWNLVSGATSYMLSWRLDTAQEEQSMTIPGMIASYEIPNLRLGRQYIITIRPVFGTEIGPKTSITERPGCSTALADVVFLVDGSSSIGAANFDKVKQFLFNMVSQWPRIGHAGTQVSIVQYSDDTSIEFPLNKFRTQQDILRAIRELPYRGGGTMTGKAIDYVLSYVFQRSAGQRSQVPNLLVIVTDGRSQDSVVNAVRRAKAAGIYLYAVGIAEANVNELRTIVTDGDPRNIVYAENFDSLSQFEGALGEVICTTASQTNVQPTGPCGTMCQKGKRGRVGPPGRDGRPGLPGPTGPRGPSGSPGSPGRPGVIDPNYPGLKGNKGEQGYPGRDGVPGTPGSSGLPGRQGDSGTRGIPGQLGIPGSTGLKGERGERGEPGPAIGGGTGYPGRKGEPGLNGAAGLPGIPGIRGESGIPGQQGPQGPIGPAGSPGRYVKGEKGEPGDRVVVGTDTGIAVKGERGDPGRPGNPGSPGARGLVGLTGTKGDKGNEGEGLPGPQGRAGEPGDRGPRGARGESGDKGDRGQAGESGPPGPKAEKGPQGPPGLKGDRGEVGLAGLPGAPGLPGGVGPRGEQGSAGRPGVPGETITGPAGSKGSQGERGPRGAEGQKGMKGDPAEKGEKGEPGYGIPGQPGPKGDRGDRGNIGLSGRPGEKGVSGDRGDKGDTGKPGVVGAAGLRGKEGEKGIKGDEGSPGEDGLSGRTGERGLRGPPGINGKLGEKGDRGDPGESGRDGSRGPAGLPGIKGDHGPQGEPGPPGRVIGVGKGMQGLRGEKGEPGKPGDSGLRGLKGEYGIPGVPGERGLQGERGLPGPQGDQGLRGFLGEKGSAGPPGIDGRNGIDGKNGAAGPPGQRGDQGKQGEPGRDGVPGLRGQQGTQGASGPQGPLGHPGKPAVDGKPGLPGKNGEDGTPGEDGRKGANGDPGSNGRDGRDGVKGERGDFGLPGLPGTQGVSGPAGPAGPPGQVLFVKGLQSTTSIPGPQGPPGTPGIPGIPGAAGSRGEKGETGPLGRRGEPGDDGRPGTPGTAANVEHVMQSYGIKLSVLQGLVDKYDATNQQIRGLPGERGIKGERGDQGERGPQGKEGMIGFPGERGFKGDKGNFGAPGPEGPPGRAVVERGSEGPSGQAGEPGKPGIPGVPGRVGETGESGRTGATGDRGEKGDQGRAGKDGVQGPIGLPGPKGESGQLTTPGYPGQRGPPGPQGPKGDIGRAGQTGPRGDKGELGAPGVRGERGEVGEKGKVGFAGSPGEPGSAGEDGKPGRQGYRGLPGRPGLPGFPGVLGRPGNQGETGLQGPSGLPGAPGPPGLKGNQGDAGLSTPGFPGPSGKMGLPGNSGPAGAVGPQGLPGLPGQVGEPGKSGVTGRDGVPGKDGQNGLSGKMGIQGPPGIVGLKGEPGPVGPPGNAVRGPPGIKGEKGNAGVFVPGITGERGTVGSPGSKGDRGEAGLRGDKGEPGIIGYPGEDGSRGAVGMKGVKGEPGIGVPGPAGHIGPTGLKGDVGSPGPPGPPGPQGLMGISGLPGLRGEGGLIGPQGPGGERGAPGFPGRDGITGVRGLPGPPGPMGIQGSIGVKGDKGENGVGVAGQRGERGEPGFRGTDGRPGLPGERGSPGLRGNVGEKGVNGDPGKSGMKGDKGDAVAIPGTPGLAGIKGEYGERGHKGNEGTKGTKGEEGPRGEKGPRGEQGDTGSMGFPGARGPGGQKGEAGESGRPGEKGIAGKAGANGGKGGSGEKGDRGFQGPKGDRGVKGACGTDGMKGSKGDSGVPGRLGFPGRKGDQGDHGTAGVPGFQGKEGLMGPKGDRGFAGQQGRKGERGEKGERGFPGIVGAPGVRGADGNVGPPGPLGPIGPNGPEGLQGQKGERGPPGEGMPGPRGTTGIQGERGDPGELGKDGLKGDRGVPGMTEDQIRTYVRQEMSEHCACGGFASNMPSFSRQIPVLKISHEEDYGDNAGTDGSELRVVVNPNDPDYEHFYKVDNYDEAMEQYDTDYPSAELLRDGVKAFRPNTQVAGYKREAYKQDPCVLPLDEGNCSKFTLRWYYHRKFRECRPFIYSGCNGNANQFPEKEECEQACKFSREWTQEGGS